MLKLTLRYAGKLLVDFFINQHNSAPRWPILMIPSITLSQTNSCWCYCHFLACELDQYLLSYGLFIVARIGKIQALWVLCHHHSSNMVKQSKYRASPETTSNGLPFGYWWETNCLFNCQYSSTKFEFEFWPKFPILDLKTTSFHVLF